MISKLSPWLQCVALLSIALSFLDYSTVVAAEQQAHLRQHSKSLFVLATLETPPLADRLESLNETKLPQWTNSIKQELQKTKVFAELFPEPGADYTLKVSIKKVPVMGGWHFNPFSAMTLEMESEWTLVATLTDKVVMKRTIKTVHSDGASVWDAYEKHQVTNRGLISKNISEGILALSLLNLD